MPAVRPDVCSDCTLTLACSALQRLRRGQRARPVGGAHRGDVLGDQPPDIGLDARERRLLLVDRVLDLGLAIALRCNGLGAPGVLAGERGLAVDDLELVRVHPPHGRRVERRRALHQIDLVEHLRQRLRREHGLQRIRRALLVRRDERTFEIELRDLQVVTRAAQLQVVVADRALGGLELLRRLVVLLDDAFELLLREDDLVIDPVRLLALRGNRVRARRRRHEGRGQKREQKRERRRDPDPQSPVGGSAEAAVNAHYGQPYQTGDSGNSAAQAFHPDRGTSLHRASGCTVAPRCTVSSSSTSRSSASSAASTSPSAAARRYGPASMRGTRSRWSTRRPIST